LRLALRKTERRAGGDDEQRPERRVEFGGYDLSLYDVISLG
jgi:hypothetical protein